jgi:thiol-disulfide isomerase/thioredoxin
MRIFIAASIILLSFGRLAAQGMEFFNGSWEEALAEAKKLERIIFVDAYAEWCGPCKRMANNVFPQNKVGEFYNKNFVNVKLDMEKGEGLVFRKKYPVSAFPTLYYIDYTGTVVQMVRGAQTVEDFIKLGRQALSKIDRSDQFAAEYEKGNREPELVYNYVKALNKAGKPSLRIANEYLNAQKDLGSEQNLRLILEATTQADSKIFDLLIQYRKQIAALESEEAVLAKIVEACEATAKKAVEFQSEDLLKEVVDKMKKNHPQLAASFATAVEMSFYLAVSDAANFLKAGKTYVKNEAAGKPEELHNLAGTIRLNFPDDAKAMKEAEGYAKQAAEKSNRFDFYLTYADILNKNGKKADAMTAANRSLELARQEGPQAVRMVEMVLERIKG